MTFNPAISEPDEPVMVIERPRISDWVWKPWYARFWWSVTAVYWGVGALGFLYRPILDLYLTDFAYYLHVVFYPVFAFVFMSVGWVIAWLNALDLAESHPEAVNKLGWERSNRSSDFHTEMMRRNDPSDPDSPSYIMNETLDRFHGY